MKTAETLQDARGKASSEYQQTGPDGSGLGRIDCKAATLVDRNEHVPFCDPLLLQLEASRARVQGHGALFPLAEKLRGPATNATSGEREKRPARALAPSQGRPTYAQRSQATHG